MKVKKFEDYKMNEHEGAGDEFEDDDRGEHTPDLDHPGFDFETEYRRQTKYAGNTQARLSRIEEKLDELLKIMKNDIPAFER